jgi:hypothetical protein
MSKAKPITLEQAKKWQARAEKAYAKMCRADLRGDLDPVQKARAERYAALWVRLVDRICDYKRQRQREQREQETRA